MITLKQVDGGEVSPKDDSLLYDFLIGQCGIFEGCTVTHNGANQLVVANGRGIIKGRVFEILSETILAELSVSGTKQGRLLIKIDLSDLSTPIKFITQTAEILPDLIQQDLNRGGNVYELPLATYTINSTVISNLVDARTTITAVTVSPEDRKSWNGKANGDSSGKAIKALDTEKVCGLPFSKFDIGGSKTWFFGFNGGEDTVSPVHANNITVGKAGNANTVGYVVSAGLNYGDSNTKMSLAVIQGTKDNNMPNDLCLQHTHFLNVPEHDKFDIYFTNQYNGIRNCGFHLPFSKGQIDASAMIHSTGTITISQSAPTQPLGEGCIHHVY